MSKIQGKIILQKGKYKAIQYKKSSIWFYIIVEVKLDYSWILIDVVSTQTDVINIINKLTGKKP